MKDALVIAGICATLIIGVTHQVDAEASDSNQAMKDCLMANGYSPEKFHYFDFSKAAGCHSDWRVGKLRAEYIQLKLFLKENPWYTGQNWQWEECAKDNTCTKRYSWWSTKEK